MHKQRLVSKKCYSEEEIHVAVEDAEKYKRVNCEQPGFFDVAINTGKLNNIHNIRLYHVCHVKIH